VRERERDPNYFGGVDYSPAKLKAIKRTMKRTEARWAEKAGPVTVRRVGDPVPPRD
jgi:hypothetical protein